MTPAQMQQLRAMAELLAGRNRDRGPPPTYPSSRREELPADVLLQLLNPRQEVDTPSRELSPQALMVNRLQPPPFQTNDAGDVLAQTMHDAFVSEGIRRLGAGETPMPQVPIEPLMEFNHRFPQMPLPPMPVPETGITDSEVEKDAEPAQEEELR
jgi:hypothetical protein